MRWIECNCYVEDVDALSVKTFDERVFWVLFAIKYSICAHKKKTYDERLGECEFVGAKKPHFH